jgi:hypothetical protein
MFEAARLLFNLDRATHLKALENTSSQDNEGRALINLDPPSVYDPSKVRGARSRP